MSEIEIRIYVDASERSPFEQWVVDLERTAQAKVTVAIARLGQGNISNVKSLGDGVAELKIDWGPGYRIYFGRDGPTLVILVAGGTKKRQNRDVLAAKARWADYKIRRSSRARQGF